MSKSAETERETTQKTNFYYIKITSPEQLKKLENGGVAFKTNKDKTIAAVAIVDKKKALECIFENQTKLKK